MKKLRLTGFAGLAGVMAVLVLAFMGGTLPTPLYELYRRRFDFAEARLTLVYSVYMAGSLAALLFFGRLSDQVGRRRVVYAGLGVAAVSTLCFVFASSVAMLFAARALSGFSVGLVSAAATAWVVELHPRQDRTAASAMSAVANVMGLGLGPTLSGLLAQHAPAPLRLPYVVFLAILAPVALVPWATAETVKDRVSSLRGVSLAPRVGVPREIRAAFLSPAAAGFGNFAVFGFYAALVPSLMARVLGEPDHALAGAVMLELCLVATVAMLLARSGRNRSVMVAGLALLVPSLGLLLLAQELRSMAVLAVGTAVSGVAVGWAYLGSLRVVNEIAPADRRAEVLASYFVACYAGVALPVIGVGVLSQAASLLLASGVFASAIAAIAVAALMVGLRYAPGR